MDPRALRRRVILASFIGTTIEWYDFFLYGAAAAFVFPALFFPKLDDFAGSMASFGTFSVGFFARPLGGVIFGHFGDRIGRRSMLVITLVLMGVATFLIGLLPTHASIGTWAPAALVFLRFVQGLGVGGEWGGAVLMAAEHAEGGKRGLQASWPQAGVPAGNLLAVGVFAAFKAFTGDQFLAWGWRVPFLLGIVLVGVGLFIRLRVLESPAFRRVQEEKGVAKLPILEVLRKHPRNVLLSMGARLAENVSFYIFTVFVFKYAGQRNEGTVLTGLQIGSALELATIPLFGLLSDRLGRRPVYMLGRSWPVAAYMAGMALITLVSVYLAEETHRTDLT